MKITLTTLTRRCGMSDKIITEKEILMHNIHELQQQLQNAYIRIGELHEQLERCLASKDKRDE